VSWGWKLGNGNRSRSFQRIACFSSDISFQRTPFHKSDAFRYYRLQIFAGIGCRYRHCYTFLQISRRQGISTGRQECSLPIAPIDCSSHRIFHAHSRFIRLYFTCSISAPLFFRDMFSARMYWCDIMATILDSRRNRYICLSPYRHRTNISRLLNNTENRSISSAFSINKPGLNRCSFATVISYPFE